MLLLMRHKTWMSLLPSKKVVTQSGSQYGPIRRRVTGKSGDATMYRPPAMRQEDFAEIMREVVPHLLQENFESPHTGQKRSHVDESNEEVVEPAASRPRTSSPEPTPTAESAAEHPVSAVALDSPNMHEEPVHEVLTVTQINSLLNDWDKHGDIEVLIAGYLAKKMSKELPPTGNSPALQEAIDDSKKNRMGYPEREKCHSLSLWQRCTAYPRKVS